MLVAITGTEIPNGVAITLAFGADLSFSGFAGCTPQPPSARYPDGGRPQAVPTERCGDRDGHDRYGDVGKEVAGGN